jgi:hypothetical protein
MILHSGPLGNPFIPLRPILLLVALQAVQMFIDEQVGYLDIIRLNEACCEAHKSDLVAYPNLEEIVHYDQWARQWVKQQVESGAFKPKVVVAVK